jgi:Tol biopolymer transport system component
VANDRNGHRDVFLHDRSTGKTSRINLAPDGTEANGISSYTPPDISGDGHYVVYSSSADNLVPGDANRESDIFVFDRRTGGTERISLGLNGNEANDFSHSPGISSDGRFVTFASLANNLVPGDSNDEPDVFLHDRSTGKTTRVNVASDGTEANVGVGLYWGWWNVVPVSDDGRFVAFNSPASNLVPGDTNGEEDVFLRDLLNEETTRISVTSDGGEADGVSLLTGMSDDGRFVLFISSAPNLVQQNDTGTPNLFIYDHSDGKTRPVEFSRNGSVSAASVWHSCISGDGGFVAFAAPVKDLVPWSDSENYGLFVLDLTTGRTLRVTMAHDGGDTNAGVMACDLSYDGRYIAFNSGADNLVAEDRNGETDAFITDNPMFFQINPGLNGSWFNPATNGQGFFIDVLPTSGLLFMSWNTFDVERPDESIEAQLGDPGHRWLVGQGPYSGNQAILNIYSSNGGVFDAAEPRPEFDQDGEMLVEFTSCRSGTVTYEIPSVDQSRVIPIQRVALDNATTCESQAGQIQTE